jgi:hypothetical protein
LPTPNSFGSSLSAAHKAKRFMSFIDSQQFSPIPSNIDEDEENSEIILVKDEVKMFDQPKLEVIQPASAAVSPEKKVNLESL